MVLVCSLITQELVRFDAFYPIPFLKGLIIILGLNS